MRRFRLLLFLALLPGLICVQTPAQRSSKRPIDAAVEKAKRSGQAKITLPSPIAEPFSITSFEDAVENSAPLVGRVVAKGTKVQVDGSIIWTWYKIRIADNICEVAPHAGKLPSETPSFLLPLRAHEFFLRLPGGAVTIDGVTVQDDTPGTFPDLSLGADYLLFVDFDIWRESASYKNVAGISYGPGVVFLVQNSQLMPIVESGNAVTEEIEAQRQNVDAVRSRIRNACRTKR